MRISSSCAFRALAISLVMSMFIMNFLFFLSTRNGQINVRKLVCRKNLLDQFNLKRNLRANLYEQAALITNRKHVEMLEEIPPYIQQIQPLNEVNASLQEQLWETCHWNIQKKILSRFEPLISPEKRIVTVDPATHSNVGDVMILQGEIELVQALGGRVEHFCGRAQDSSKWVDDCGEFDSNWIALFQGGGNWGDLYPEVHDPRKAKIQSFLSQGVRTIQMPVTVHWNDTESPNFGEEVEFWRNLNDMHNGLAGRVSVFVRQQNSFDFMKREFPDVKTFTSPDIAFMMKPIIASGAVDEVDVLFLLREDKESKSFKTKSLTEAFPLLSKAGIESAQTDWGLIHFEANFTEGKQFDRLARILYPAEYYSRAKIIVTDRLHGSILAFLMNKPHIMLDNTHGKVRKTRQLAFDGIKSCSDASVQGCYAQDMREVVAIIQRLLGIAKIP